MSVSEDTAKAAWLAKLDSEKVANPLSAAPAVQSLSEDAAAKAAWLAKVDPGASWKGGSGPATDPLSAAPAASAMQSLSEDAAAKAAWLAKLDPGAASWKASSRPVTDPVVVTATVHAVQSLSDEAAKAAWLAKLDSDASWKEGSARVVLADITPGPEASLQQTEPPLAESAEAAKAAWLTKLDPDGSRTPSGTAPAPAVPAPSPPPVAEVDGPIMPTQRSPRKSATSWGTKMPKANWLAPNNRPRAIGLMTGVQFD